MSFESQTITITDNKDRNYTSSLEISPALEESCAPPVSTHWIPLHELISHWTEVDTMLLPAPVAPVLAAVGHALLALARETRALRLYTLAWERQQWHASARATKGLCTLAVRHLHEAAHHWSQAAATLDSLLPKDLDPTALERTRRLSRIASAQQARVCKLIEEVRSDVESWCAQQGQDKEVR